MMLTDHLRALLSLVQATHMPTADEIRAALETRARDISEAGPFLVAPVWAYAVGGAEDIFVELEPEGDVPGMRLWNDSRGWGSYAEISVRRGTLRDVHEVIGQTSDTPRRGPLFATAFGEPTVAGHRVPITIQHQDGAVRIVSLQFDNLTKS
jgi:hypothetical protein